MRAQFNKLLVNITCDWLLPRAWLAPAGLDWRPGQVTVFRLPLTGSPLAPLASAVLTEPELARAGRYRQATDQQRFLIARTALRLLLGRLTQQPAAAVQLAASATHKPYVVGWPALHFSLAHTREWVLLALAGSAVGIDVEEINPSFEFAEVLQVSFNPHDSAAIISAPDPARLFYQAWTRKEALVKATGQGIDDNFPQLPSLPGRYQLAGPLGSAWRVSGFEVAGQHVGALAYQPTHEPAPPAFCDFPTELLIKSSGIKP